MTQADIEKGTSQGVGSKTVKILLLDDAVAHFPTGYDHVFSFFPNPADSFPDSFVSWEQYREICDHTFEVLLERIKQSSLTENFFYKDVNLLWCFKKELFNFSADCALRYELLSRLVSKFGPCEFHVFNEQSKKTFHLLTSLIQNSPLRDKICIQNVCPEAGHDEASMRSGRSCSAKLWPSRFQKGKWDSSEIIIFSDFAKTKGLLPALQRRRVAYYSDVRAPRLALRSFRNHFSLFQADSGGHIDRILLVKSRAFVDSLETSDLFRNFYLGQLNAKVILTNGLRAIFERTLPKLLYDIDAIDLFFKKTSFAKSALLDEDIAPTKNAFCQIAKKYGVLTYVECHGALGENSGFTPVTADFIFVWGNAQKEKLVGWGCPDEKIIVSGCSRYSSYRKMGQAASKKRVCRALKLNPRKKVVLIGFPPINRKRMRFFEDKWLRIFMEVLEAVKQHSDLQYVIKIKAKSGDELKGLSQEWIRRQGLQKSVKVVEKYDPLQLAKAADFLIVFGSTLAVEGFALGKPVIWLYDEASAALAEFRKFKVFCYASNKDDLEKHMRLLAAGHEPSRESWATAYDECLNIKGCCDRNVIASHLLSNHRD